MKRDQLIESLGRRFAKEGDPHATAHAAILYHLVADAAVGGEHMDEAVRLVSVLPRGDVRGFARLAHDWWLDVPEEMKDSEFGGRLWLACAVLLWCRTVD